MKFRIVRHVVCEIVFFIMKWIHAWNWMLAEVVSFAFFILIGPSYSFCFSI